MPKHTDRNEKKTGRNSGSSASSSDASDTDQEYFYAEPLEGLTPEEETLRKECLAHVIDVQETLRAIEHDFKGKPIDHGVRGEFNTWVATFTDGERFEDDLCDKQITSEDLQRINGRLLQHWINFDTFVEKYAKEAHPDYFKNREMTDEVVMLMRINAFIEQIGKRAQKELSKPDQDKAQEIISGLKEQLNKLNTVLTSAYKSLEDTDIDKRVHDLRKAAIAIFNKSNYTPKNRRP